MSKVSETKVKSHETVNRAYNMWPEISNLDGGCQTADAIESTGLSGSYSWSLVNDCKPLTRCR